MSDTPRTDECLEDHAFDDKHEPHTDWVPASFARTLERENAELKAALILARKWGISCRHFSLIVSKEITQWIDGEMKGPPPKEPDYFPKE